MGLQDRDRDCYRERNKTPGQTPNLTPKKPPCNNIKIIYLLYPLITLSGLWYGADTFLGKTNETVILQNHNPSETLPGGVVLKADRQGHFRGTVLINNIPMPFLVDTGATKTSIPAKMAITANLPFGSEIKSNTAGGQISDHMTRINNLKIGGAEIINLNANINQYLDEVLIGMNTLKYFHMTQSGDTLTLIANNQKDGDVMLKQINGDQVQFH
jgi:aspartyl protease family protein